MKSAKGEVRKGKESEHKAKRERERERERERVIERNKINYLCLQSDEQ